MRHARIPTRERQFHGDANDAVDSAATALAVNINTASAITLRDHLISLRLYLTQRLAAARGSLTLLNTRSHQAAKLSVCACRTHRASRVIGAMRGTQMNSWLQTFTVTMAMAGAAIAHAQSVPNAYSSGSLDGAGPDGYPGSFSNIPAGASLSADLSSEGQYSDGTQWSDSYKGRLDTSVAKGGLAQITLEASFGNAVGVFRGGAADVSVFYRVGQKANAPFDAPWIPIFYAAKGAGYVEGGGGSYYAGVRFLGGSFGLGPPGPAYDLYAVNGVGPGQSEFDKSETLLMIPGELYVNKLHAQCSVYAPVGPYVTGSIGCGAIVDPTLSFDQATFDAFYGSASYKLADYYNLDMSPNAVPEPSAYVLFLIGFAMFVTVHRNHWQLKVACASRPDKFLALSD